MQSIHTALPLAASYKTTRVRVTLRKTFLRLILIALGVCIGFVICEIIMRAFHLGHARTVVLYNEKIFKLPPHVAFMNLDENRNLVETNNFGFHDRDRDAANKNYRILFMGDSFVEGRQVDTESLFTMRLEKKFSDVEQKVESINGGVAGTGTAYQYSLWKEFFEPNVKVDHVVLCFFMGNDLVDNSAELKFLTSREIDNSFFLDSAGQVIATRKQPGLLKSSLNYVRDRSFLFDRIYEIAYRTKSNLVAESGEAVGDEGNRIDRSGAWEASEQGTLALIKRWRSELSEKKTAFDVVIIDRPGRLYNKFESEFLTRLLTACAGERISCLRLKLTADPFESYSFDGVSLGHFNYKGHESAANELYDFLKSHHPEISNRPAPNQ
jgi:hypothetical protein